MKMYIGGQWMDSSERSTVTSPYSGEVIDTISAAQPSHVEQTLEAAVAGAAVMARLSAFDRNRILCRAADLVAANAEDLARTISLEEGKPLTESRGEVGRLPDLLR